MISDNVTLDISSDCMKQYNFNKLKSELIDMLQKDLHSRTDVSEQAYINYLLNQDMNNYDEINRIIFAYNDGNLRSYEELNIYDNRKKHWFLYNNYNFIRHLINCLCLFVPFCLLFNKTLKESKNNILLFPIGLAVSLLASYICGMFGYTLNIGLASHCGIAEDDPRVESEHIKRKVGIFAGVVGGASTIRHAKKNIRDFTNVDSWKEMK